MIFQNPLFLWGLLAIAVPVAVHLFNFRKHKTIYFSTLRFLRAVQQDTKSQSKLRHLLVLLARCLVIIALVMAFAGPFLPGTEADKKKAAVQRIALYIDNSFSTNAEGAEGQVLESERKRARNIIAAYGRVASFLVYSNDFTTLDEQALSYDRAIERIGSIHQSSSSHTISEALVRGRDILKKTDNTEASNKLLYLISDFQKTATPIASFTNDSAVRTVLIPVAGQQTNNLYVDSCWFESPIHAPQQAEQLLVRVRNSSSEEYSNIPVRLFVNDSLKTVASASLKAGGEAVLTLTYNNAGTGLQWGRVEIADFPVTFDNEYYFSYRIANSMPVLCIGDEHAPLRKSLEALFHDDQYCKASFVNMDQVVYSDFAKYRLIILFNPSSLNDGIIEQLQQYMQASGSVCFIPKLINVLGEYNSFLNKTGFQFGGIDSSHQRLKTIDYKHPLFKTVFKRADQSVLLPEVLHHYTIRGKQQSGSMSLLQCENGDDFLVSAQIGQGTLYVFTSSLVAKGEGFTSHPLFVASLYNMALLHEQEEAMHYVIGRNTVIQMQGNMQQSDRVLHLRATSGAFDVIPRMMNDMQHNSCRLFVENLIREAGLYRVTASNNDSALAVPAFNYNRIESVLDFYTPSELSDLLQSKGLQSIGVFDKNADLLTESIRKANNGTPLWKWFVLLAILGVLTEAALLWKRK